MRKPKYYITVSLQVRDEFNPSKAPQVLHATMVFRGYNQGAAQLRQDYILELLKQHGVTLEAVRYA